MYRPNSAEKTFFATMSVCTLTLATLLLSGCSNLEQESFGSPRNNDETSAPRWKTTVSEDGKFKVSLPGNPTRTTKKLETAVGVLDMHMYIVERKSGRVAYLVTIIDYPRIDDRDAALTGGVEGLTGSIDGTVTNESSIEVAGYPGRDVTFEASADGQRLIGHTRLLLVENRLYQLMVIGARGEVQRSDADKLFRSFQLLPV